MRTDKEFVLGGQAVIEGVMMKGGEKYAVAVRSPAGDIVTETFSIKRYPLAMNLQKTIFIRGLLILFSMLIIGVKALSYSAAVASEEDETLYSPLLMGVTLLAALSIAILLFFLIPFLAGVVFARVSGMPVGGLVFNLVEGVIRILIFFLYIWGISLIEDIRRVFEYHGAEHKVVNAYEDKASLEVEEIQGYSRFHPRCGTSFILFVLIISILVFSVIPGDLSIISKGMMRLMLLPVIAGFSYELIRLTGKRRESLLFRIISGPGMLLQKATTREPRLEQIEVALVSLHTLSEHML